MAEEKKNVEKYGEYLEKKIVFLWRRRRTKKEREEITRRREGKLMLTSTVDELNME